MDAAKRLEPSANKSKNKGHENLHPWKPGQSGNPSGRPKGGKELAVLIKEKTSNGKEIAEHFVRILHAKPYISNVNGSEVPIIPTMKDINKAAEWLANRLWGKPDQTLNINAKIEFPQLLREAFYEIVKEEDGNKREERASLDSGEVSA